MLDIGLVGHCDHNIHLFSTPSSLLLLWYQDRGATTIFRRYNGAPSMASHAPPMQSGVAPPKLIPQQGRAHRLYLVSSPSYLLPLELM
jgi:hypothetical protein